VPFFQAYLKYIDDQEVHEVARAAFASQVPFQSRGNHTLQITLDENGIRAAEEGLSAVLDIPKRIESGELLDPKAPDKS
jgi:hypothetical protein